jgi:hypothetical protein
VAIAFLSNRARIEEGRATTYFVLPTRDNVIWKSDSPGEVFVEMKRGRFQHPEFPLERMSRQGLPKTSAASRSQG